MTTKPRPYCGRSTYEEPGQHYGPEDAAEARCAYCGMRMVKALVDAEPQHLTHPSCPDPPKKRPTRKRRKT